MHRYGIQSWKQLPFLRLLVPLCTGILVQRYYAVPPSFFIAGILAAVIALVVFLSYRFSLPYHWRWINGIFIGILFMSAGGILMYIADTRNNNRWIGHYLSGATYILAYIQEPLTEKPRSYKTTAKAEAIWRNGKWISVSGNLLLYISKSHADGLAYGRQILIRKQLQPITNRGSPGSFDYRQYCASQGIHYQVFLGAGDYRLTGRYSVNAFTGWLLRAREWVLRILKQSIPGEKEAGVAEALLIGYRNDLDQDLVQAYSHTGVVHIIAISGLHLGMIYGLMLALLKPFRKTKWIRWVKPGLILTVLWVFCLLTGAAASILRSAVMFTFIIAGESLGRKTQVYNTLAASAFCLLAYRPWFLWDAGFQLSYTAVLGILLFMKPLYRLIYCPNKLLNGIWQLNAITLSAQVFTLPLVLYYFHQFPNLFLFTNFIAVPLSGIILYGELLLLMAQGIPAVGVYTGKAVSFSIQLMNGLIERTDRLPFSVTAHIHISLPATCMLYLCIIFMTAWLFLKRPFYAVLSLAALTAAIIVENPILEKRARQPTFAPPFSTHTGYSRNGSLTPAAPKTHHHAKENAISTDLRFL